MCFFSGKTTEKLSEDNTERFIHRKKGEPDEKSADDIKYDKSQEELH